MKEGEIFKKIYEIFGKEKVEIYLVGGAVRDTLRGEEIKDIDFATPVEPPRIKKILNGAGIRTYPVGWEFGTVGAVIGGKEVHITTYRRKEKYKPGDRKPEVEFGGSIEEDLRRRDFTINAMALTPEGKLIDPFGGREDLEKGIIRTPQDPDDSFQDDPLRMLRAFRFQSQLGFKIEKNTFDSIKRNAFRVMILSKERIQMEMNKLLVGKFVEKALLNLMNSTLLNYFLYELYPLKDLHQSIQEHHKDVWKHTVRVVGNTPPEEVLRWAALLHDIAKPYVRSVEQGEIHFYRHEDLGAEMAFHILTRLKFPKKMVKEVAFLVAKHMRPALYRSEWTDSAVRRFIREMGERLEKVMTLAKADITSYRPERVRERLRLLEELSSRVERLLSVREVTCPVNGFEIMERFSLSPGPLIGKIKSLLLEGILNGELPETSEDKEIYFQFIEKKLPSLLANDICGEKKEQK